MTIDAGKLRALLDNTAHWTNAGRDPVCASVSPFLVEQSHALATRSPVKANAPHPSRFATGGSIIMGTRIDFWIGIDKNAEWIGSIGLDGYLEAVPHFVAGATDPDDFRHHVAAHIRDEDGIPPAKGWQWPWKDSRTSDNSVWFANGIVYFESDGWLIPMNQLAAFNESDDERHASRWPGAIKPDWSALPDMLQSPSALYGDGKRGKRTDAGAGPIIIAHR
jgi:hypothetical protein